MVGEIVGILLFKDKIAFEIEEIICLAWRLKKIFYFEACEVNWGNIWNANGKEEYIWRRDNHSF